MNGLGRRKWLTWAALGGILIIAAWLRIVAVEETVIDYPLRADAGEYYLSAYNLTFHGTYSRSRRGFYALTTPLVPDAVRYPGLPLVICALIWADSRFFHRAERTGGLADVLRDAQWVNAGAGVAAVGLVFLAAQTALPLWAALAAALLTAISPHLVSFTVYLLTEPISVMLTCLLLAAVAAVAAKGEGLRRLGPFVGIGIIVGLLALFRPIYLLATPVFVLAFVGQPALRKTLIGALIATALVVAPWYVRNAVSVPVHGQTGYPRSRPPDGAHPDKVKTGASPHPAQADHASSKASAGLLPALGGVVRRGATVFGDRLGRKVEDFIC